MKAMVWKELRECGTWAVLALMLTVIINIFAYKMSTWSHDLTQVWDGKVVVNVVAGTLTGALLGTMQILPELRRDRWAFLLHRPIAVPHLFAGKVIAGLLLLVTIICLSDAVIYYWIRFHLGQEVISFWYFLMSIYVGLVVGTIFYFAVIIASLRPARIFGSRFLSIFGALAASIFSLAVMEMWESLVVAIVSILVSSVAALGCFCAKGEYERMTALTRFTLGGVLLSGSVVIGVCIAAIIGDAVPAGFEMSEPEESVALVEKDSSYKSIVADTQGRVLLVSFDTTRVSKNKGDYVYSYSGCTLPEKKAVKIPPTKYPNLYFVSSDLIKGDRRTTFNNSMYIEPSFIHFIYEPYTKIIESKDKKGSQVLYDNINRRIAFYSRKQGRFTGYIGPGGYYGAHSIPSPEKARFPGKLLSAPTDKFYWFSNAIYRIEVGKRLVKRIIVIKPGESIQSIAPVTEGKRQLLWIVRNHSVEKYDEDGNRLYSVGLEPTEQNANYIAIADAGPEIRLLWLGDIQTAQDGQRSLHSKIIETTVSGEVRRKFDLPVFPTGKQLSTPFRDILLRIAFPLTNYMDDFDSYGESLESGYDILGLRPTLPPAVPLRFLLWSGFVSASIVWIIAMRCEMPLWQQLLWIIIAFPFGPSAVLTLLALRAWPQRFACKQCGKKRKIEHEHCKYCQARWPKPERNGTEILPRDIEISALGSGGRQ